jgi:hypothetical protein
MSMLKNHRNERGLARTEGLAADITAGDAWHARA